MLPLGSRGSKKCSECGITAHTRCEHNVPHFCGLSMEMANQMLAEIKAAAKRKTLESKGSSTSSSSRISKQQTQEKVDMDAPLPAIPVSSSPSIQHQQVDEELSSQLSTSATISSSSSSTIVATQQPVPQPQQQAPVPPQKSPIVVPQTPPSMYNQNPLGNQQPQPQQPYYSPTMQHQPMSMPQPNRIYSQQPQQQQQQRPPPPSLPTHQQVYGYNGPPLNVDPRYQQQQQQQMYYQQQQQRPPYNNQSPYPPQQQSPHMMGRPQPNPNYYPQQQQPQVQQPQVQQQQVVQQPYGGQQPPQPLQKQPSMMKQQQGQGGPRRKVVLDNFSFLAVLGKGNFGKVMLAEEKFDKKLYAIKMLKKRFIIDNDEIER